ncbi:MAG: helix-hairpin-helix domain-containing protein [Clostridia bacterium]|nr:helix-hairpin-helix domain-containing protein [Clostridia bacterium]
MKEPIDLKFEEIETSPDAININTATKEEIMELEGVGEALADKIIDYRKVKPFETVHDITLISGFGEKLFEDNKEMIKVK